MMHLINFDQVEEFSVNFEILGSCFCEFVHVWIDGEYGRITL
jgi:hypothetical protein